MMKSRSVVLVPTYNERESLPHLLKAVVPLAQANDYELFFLDDQSPDGTGKFLDEVAAQTPCVRVFHGPPKRGLAGAYIDGFRQALDSGATKIMQMDADLSHPPEAIADMFALLDSCEVVVGSRYRRGGGTRNWPWHRRLISRGGSLYARTILGIPLSDLTGGFNAWRASVLEKILEPAPASRGYSFQVEMKYRAYRAGFRMMEYPIVFTEREWGVSKMSSDIVLEAALRVLQWRFRRPWELT
jgi:dolichol-phosphate mannosyltransferase